MPDTPTPSPDALIEEVENGDRWDVYVSASWKQRDRVRAFATELRRLGLHVYDFTDPACRNVPEIPPERFPDQFDAGRHVYSRYIQAVPEWRAAVDCNRRAIASSRIVALLLPCGHDAHADWAFGVGHGCRSVVIGQPRNGERTPTHMWADAIVDTDAEGLAWCVRNAAEPTRTQALASHLRAAMAENVCDACAGTGKPTSGLTCMCGGTGKMSVAAPVLREIAVQANARADTALSDVEAMRANWASAVNDIAAFLESCDDSRDDPLAYAAGEVRRRWGSALDARGQSRPETHECAHGNVTTECKLCESKCRAYHSCRCEP